MVEVSEQQLEAMKDFVRDRLAPRSVASSDNYGAFRGDGQSRWDHTLRVLQVGREIARAENADEDIVAVAIIFHDVAKLESGDVDHGRRGAQICAEYLSNLGYPTQWVNQVSRVIAAHTNPQVPDPEIEKRVLLDADRLDETGALGIVWSCINSGRGTAPSYNDALDRIARLDLRGAERMVEKMQTQTGKRLALDRLAFVQAFISELEREGLRNGCV